VDAAGDLVEPGDGGAAECDRLRDPGKRLLVVVGVG
jgi:hypothetical protein